MKTLINIIPAPTAISLHNEMLEMIRLHGSEILKDTERFLEGVRIMRELQSL